MHAYFVSAHTVHWWKGGNITHTHTLPLFSSVPSSKGFNPAERFQCHLLSSEMSLRQPAGLHTALWKYCFQSAIYRRVSRWIVATFVRFPSHRKTLFYFLNPITHTQHCTGGKHTQTHTLSGHKSAGTRPLQAWCNIQGFIQSLNTVHQSEIYSEPSTKVRQVHHKTYGRKKDF